MRLRACVAARSPNSFEGSIGGRWRCGRGGPRIAGRRGTGGFRLTFQIKPKDDKPVELRAYLERGGDVLSETWSYVWLN
ncbi:MAG: hypothetical protein FJ148_17590 [Deltaproteobacteria bacterium]|nr:hypothetical protein [Deltaproteobacteria bacterium]